MIGYPEMIIIIVIALFLFGPDKIPEIACSIGKSVKEFKKAQMDASEELKTAEKPTEGSDSKIYKLVTEMGIDTKNKTVEQLTDEIRVKMSLRAEK